MYGFTQGPHMVAQLRQDAGRKGLSTSTDQLLYATAVLLGELVYGKDYGELGSTEFLTGKLDEIKAAIEMN